MGSENSSGVCSISTGFGGEYHKNLNIHDSFSGRLAPVLKTITFFLIISLGASLIYILVASLILMAKEIGFV